ncbi:hypothetical protein HZS_3802 [Henneguya salminicola]|nr:hypothetical protein HZS_3802 [Henneguya salminicola]
MIERKDKSLLYFFISVTFLHSLSTNVVEDIIVRCGSSYTILIDEDSSSWISSAWKFVRQNGKSLTMLTYETDDGDIVNWYGTYRESSFILDYGVHYLSLYQMSIILNQSMITFTSYSEKEMGGQILLRKIFKIKITGKTRHYILN